MQFSPFDFVRTSASVAPHAAAAVVVVVRDLYNGRISGWHCSMIFYLLAMCRIQDQSAVVLLGTGCLGVHLRNRPMADGRRRFLHLMVEIKGDVVPEITHASVAREYHGRISTFRMHVRFTIKW